MPSLPQIHDQLNSELEERNFIQIKDNLNLHGISDLLSILHIDSIPITNPEIQLVDNILLISGHSDAFGKEESEFKLFIIESDARFSLELKASIENMAIPGYPTFSIQDLAVVFRYREESNSLSGEMYGKIITADLEIPIAVDLTDNHGGLTFRINSSSISLTDLEALIPFAGGDGLDLQLPPQLSGLSTFSIREFAINISESSVNYITTAITITERWEIIADHFSILDIQLNLNFLYPASDHIDKRIDFSFSAIFEAGNTQIPVLLEKGEEDSWRLLIAGDGGVEIPDLNDILAFAGGDETANLIPKELKDLPSIIIANLELSFNPDNKTIDSISFEIESTKPWTPPGTSEFTLDILSYKMEVENPMDSSLRKIKGSTGAITKFGDSIILSVGGEFDEGDLVFNANYNGTITIAEVGDVLGFSDKPEGLENFQFTGFDLSLNADSSDKYLSGTGVYRLADEHEVSLNLVIHKTSESTAYSGSFLYPDVDGRGNDMLCEIYFTPINGGYDSNFILKFPVANKIIDLTGSMTKGVDSLNSKTEFAGSLRDQINLISLLDGIFPEHEDSLPTGLLPGIAMEDVFLAYYKEGDVREISLSAIAIINDLDVKFFFQSRNNGNESSYALGLETSLPGLTGLPMVGAQMRNVKIKNVGFIYASKAGTWDGREFEAGLTVGGELWLPHMTEPKLLKLQISGAKEKKSATDTIEGGKITQPTASEPTQGTAAASSTPINKSLGPFRISDLGFEYDAPHISLIFNGHIQTAGLSMSLIGLGLRFNLSELFKGEINAPSFSIDGLGLGFKRGPTEISGAFLKEPGKALAFSGGAVIKAQDFAISALGAYSTINGDPSLFVFGLYEGAMGGPPFFTVEGLAAGFGYNRKVVIPEIEDVENFPFVRLATTPANASRNPAELLPTLSKHLKPSGGDYWLAIGVKFNSFKLVDSFALMIASFSQTDDFRLDILGVSKLVFPVQKKVPGKKPPAIIAEIRMAFKAIFIPAQGFLGIKAQLTEGSYILSKDCVLTGGFAFYSWFEGSKHAGDFVQTMGGYHPSFKKPVHYPDVPRLAFNWNVSKYVTIKGEMYFAMTPSMCMAGGRLEASYKKGSISAWFIIGADFLISWEPYFYDAKFYVNVGARFKKDCGLFTIVVTVDVGADVHIWGPEMRGTAAIDIGICTINVSFGAKSSPARAFINWDHFQTSFLSQNESDICNVLVNNGLIQTSNFEGEDRWIINPKDFVIATDSMIPLKNGETENVKRSDAISNVKLNSNNKGNFGIDPIGLTSKDIHASTQTISISKEGADGDEAVNDDFSFEPIYKKFPKALWKEAGATPGNPSLTDTEGTTDDILAGFRISPAKIPEPGRTKVIDQDNLEVEISANETAFSLDKLGTKSFKQNGTLEDITETIALAKRKRENLMKSFFPGEKIEFQLEGINEDCFMRTPLIIKN